MTRNSKRHKSRPGATPDGFQMRGPARYHLEKAAGRLKRDSRPSISGTSQPLCKSQTPPRCGRSCDGRLDSGKSLLIIFAISNADHVTNAPRVNRCGLPEKGFVAHSYECPGCTFIHANVEPDPVKQAEGWLKGDLKKPERCRDDPSPGNGQMPKSIS